jgi:hypothetical protein
MKYFSVFILLFLTFDVNPRSETIQLKSFNEILEALNKGEKVNAVIHYADCKLTAEGKEAKSPDEIAGMQMLPFEYYAAGVITKRGFISSSETVRVFLAGFNGFVDNYMKVRVYDDNAVEITVKYITTDKLEVQSDKLYAGEINDGSNGKGVYFFIQR